MGRLESDPTEMSLTGEKHPTLAELRDGSHPNVAKHLADCAMCRSIVDADGATPAIALDLPKGLVDENAFKWPADPMARGGMAMIFAGHDRRLGRTVILKAPREGDDVPPAIVDMFQRRVTAEARILAKLQHPSIVTIYELGKSTIGWPFCVLEKVEGTALRDRLDELAEQEAESGKPCTRERLELLSNLVAIAEALAYAHERRVVHRDCTPNNILLGKRGEATLIDWGIARDLDAPGGNDAQMLDDMPPSATGRMVTISAGTPPYLPLEQSQGRAADPSFDVYSFGVSLYETIAGRTPFEWKSSDGPGDRTKQLSTFLDWLKSDEPIAPAMPRDPELSGIIARAIDRDPSKRFTADELVRALKQYLTGDLVFSHRYSVTGRLARWARQHKATTIAMASIVVFAIGGALVWAQLSRAAREEAELRAIASAAKADASEKATQAEIAVNEAEKARLEAEQAEKAGLNAEAAKKKALAAAQAAQRARDVANAAAKKSDRTADEALRQYQQAMRAKEEAETAQANALAAQKAAETARDAAQRSKEVADRERDAARVAQANADRARENADKERDSAVAGREAAERAAKQHQEAADRAREERDASITARKELEKDLAEAKRRIAELEARRPPPNGGSAEPPPPPPPGP